MKYLLGALLAVLCLCPIGAMAQGCRGTYGMTSCDFPQGDTRPPPSTNPRPAAPDDRSKVPYPSAPKPTDRGKTPPGTIAR
jgi:hypothetical protein